MIDSVCQIFPMNLRRLLQETCREGMAPYVKDFFEFNFKTTFLTWSIETILELKFSSNEPRLFCIHWYDGQKCLVILSMSFVLDTVEGFKSKFFVMFVRIIVHWRCSFFSFFVFVFCLFFCNFHNFCFCCTYFSAEIFS